MIVFPRSRFVFFSVCDPRRRPRSKSHRRKKKRVRMCCISVFVCFVMAPTSTCMPLCVVAFSHDTTPTLVLSRFILCDTVDGLPCFKDSSVFKKVVVPSISAQMRCSLAKQAVVRIRLLEYHPGTDRSRNCPSGVLVLLCLR